MPENNALTNQYKKTKSGLTPEQEKMMGLDKPLTPEELAIRERNRARMAQRKKEEEEKATLLGGFKKGLKDWYEFNLGSGPERRGASAE